MITVWYVSAFLVAMLALWIAKDTADRLRCLFFSALQYRFAASVLMSLPCVARALRFYVFFNHGYFDSQRNYLYYAFLLSILTLPAAPLALAAGEFTVYLTVCFGYIMLGAGPWAVHLLFGRVRGTDGRLHERFNRFAPLSVINMREIEYMRNGARFTPLFTGNLDPQNDEAADQIIDKTWSGEHLIKY